MARYPLNRKAYMSQRTKVAVAVTLLLTAGALLLSALRVPLVVRGELAVFDGLARIGRTAPADSSLVFLAIDNDSVSLDADADLRGFFEIPEDGSQGSRALYLMAKGWPWSREVYALALDRLFAAGARAVAFDLTFPTAGVDDDAFRHALKRYRDRVVVGSNFISASQAGQVFTAATYSLPSESVIPKSDKPDERVAFVNFWPDADEVVRQAQYRVTFEQVRGDMPNPDSEVYLSLAARVATILGLKDALPGGLEPVGIRLAAPPHEGFRPRSIFEIFVPEYWEQNFKNGKAFKDKVVLIGASGNWQHDEHRTAFGLMPGPELQLNSLNALLKGEFLRDAPFGLNAAVIAFSGLLSMGLWLSVRSGNLRMIAIGALLLAGALGALTLYNEAGLRVTAFTPIVLLASNGLIGFVYDFTNERHEKKKVRKALDRYVSRNVVDELLNNSQTYRESLGGVLRPVTILFLDIRGFTLFSSTHKPDAVVKQLNEFLASMVECVFRYHGTLDKFIGDAVMAVWGNVKSAGPANDGANAVRAAFAMFEALDELNRKWRNEGRPTLDAGIALDHGEVVVGNIGSPQRMEFTVIGEAVNMTWRIQELTKSHRGKVLIGPHLAALVESEFELTPTTLLTLPGHPTLEIFSPKKKSPASTHSCGDLRRDRAREPVSTLLASGETAEV